MLILSIRMGILPPSSVGQINSFTSIKVKLSLFERVRFMVWGGVVEEIEIINILPCHFCYILNLFSQVLG